MDAATVIDDTDDTACGAVDVLVVGGGQAGLAAADAAQRRGLRAVVVDDGPALGHTWRQRWDSLRLFTPAGFSHLPGLALAAADPVRPTKDELADHVAAFAAARGLVVEHGTRATGLGRCGDLLVVSTTARPRAARRLVVATGAHHGQHVPAFATGLPAHLLQLTSRTYRRPAQVPGERVLVVGAGNSGAEIALDLAAAGRRVLLSGRDVGHLPLLPGRGDAPSEATFGVLRAVGPLGARLARRRYGGGGDPLVRVRRGDLGRAGVRRVPRSEGAAPDGVLLADATTAVVDAVVWATGSTPGLGWLGADLLAADGAPRHRGGLSTVDPRIGFVGLPYQRSAASHLVGGVGGDARHVVGRLAAGLR